MKTDLDPAAVTARLAELGRLYVPESIDDARVRLERERPTTTATFADIVQHRLDELRALCELATHLQRRDT